MKYAIPKSVKCVIHKDILRKLFLGDKNALAAFSNALSQKWSFVASATLLDQLQTDHKNAPKTQEPFWDDANANVEKTIVFQVVDVISYLYQKWSKLISDSSWILTFVVAEQSGIPLIWTDTAPQLSFEFKGTLLQTKDLTNPEKLTQFLVLSDQFLQSEHPSFVPESDIPQKKEKIDSEENPDEQDYTNYGVKEDFHWLKDDRLDPMFYERFLHFYGLKCLNDGKIYYLNPEEKTKLSLPDLSRLDEKSRVLKIEREDTGFDNCYSFNLYEIDIPKWRYYWQFFLHQDDSDKFQEGGEVIKKDADDDEERIVLHIRESVPKKKSQKNNPPKKLALKQYSQGSDIFTTGLSFSEFSLPNSIIEMHPDDASEYLGINVKIIDDESEGLRIQNQVFGIGLLGFLNRDCYQEELNTETQKDWEKIYDFSFEERK